MSTPRYTKKTYFLIGIAAILAMALVGYVFFPAKPYSNPLKGIHVYPMKLYNKEREHVVGVLCENGMHNDCVFFLEAVRSIPNLRIVGAEDNASSKKQPEFWFVFHRYDAFSYITMISIDKDYKKEGNPSGFVYAPEPLDGSERPLRKDSIKSTVASLVSQVD